jgi:hypothetical protein
MREVRVLSVRLYGQNVFSRKELNDDAQKHKGRPRTSHTDENCVTVEGLIGEDRRVKIREITEVTGTANDTKRYVHVNGPARRPSL